MTVFQIIAFVVAPPIVLVLGCFLPVPGFATAWFKRRAGEV